MKTTILPVLAIVLVLPAVAAAAPARPPSTVPAGLNETVETAHFIVHYTTATGDPNASTAEHARALADSGEKAYTVEVGQWGFAPPLDDGDARTDIYVFAGTQGLARGDTGGDRVTGYITYTPTGHPIHVPHEFFHLVQFGIYTREAGWLDESTADWAALGVAGARTGDSKPFAFAHPWISLDCLGTMPTDCEGDRYGYHGNVFFEYVSENYGGPGTIREIFERAAALGAGNHQAHALQAVGETLAAHGASTERAWNEYAVASAAGRYTLPGLSTLRPQVSHTLFAGISDPDTTTVDHLAAMYVGIEPSSDVCGKATLRLTVTVPEGVPAEPAFVDGKGNVTPASSPVDIPWSACAGEGTVVLPNPSATVDDAEFRIETKVTRVPTAPPTLKLTVARKVTLAGRKPKLRFKMTSSGAGVASITLHSRAAHISWLLHKGTSRVTLGLPKGFKAGRHKLVVVPISTSGVKGKTLTRKVKIRLKPR